MPALMIEKVNGNWTARVGGTEVSYPFVGARASDQEVSVQHFIAAIDEGRAALDAGAPEIFVVPPGVTATALVDSLVLDSDTVIYQGRPIWSCVGADKVLDDHHSVAQALRDALGGAYGA